MKKTRAFRVFALATVGAIVNAQSPDQRRIVGKWSGTGTFFNAELHQRVGALTFEASFDAKSSGAGRIGAARLEQVRVESRQDHIEIKAKLAGTVANDPRLEKDHVVFVITSVSDSTMQGEFHLKSNGVFDPRMREGRMTLRRVQ